MLDSTYIASVLTTRQRCTDEKKRAQPGETEGGTSGACCPLWVPWWSGGRTCPSCRCRTWAGVVFSSGSPCWGCGCWGRPSSSSGCWCSAAAGSLSRSCSLSQPSPRPLVGPGGALSLWTVALLVGSVPASRLARSPRRPIYIACPPPPPPSCRRPNLSFNI